MVRLITYVRLARRIRRKRVAVAGGGGASGHARLPSLVVVHSDHTVSRVGLVRLFPLVASLIAIAIAIVAMACADRPDPEKMPELRAPDKGQFVDAGVSLFLARRCGSLDCHGQVGRPLRLYGQTGLRFDIVDAAARDTRPMTTDEHLANYRSVIGLEPEELSYSVDTRAEYRDFMLFKKPLSIEGGGVRHKGGQVLRASDSDPGWVCLRSWIEGAANKESCAAATF